MLHLIAVAAALALAEPSPSTSASEGPDLHVDLLADVSHVAPGAEFHVALRLKIPVGWHVYGENPGETGLATRAELQGPEGFRIGAPRYPAPTRHVESTLTSYIYEEEVALFFPVRAPEDLDVGSDVVFEASASWLACKGSCVPGRGRAALELAVEAGAPRPAHAAELASHVARLPLPWEELEGGILRWYREGETRTVRLQAAGARELDFLPGPPATWGAKGIESKQLGDALAVDVELERVREEPEVAPTLDGILRVVDAKRRERFFAVHATRAGAP